MKPFNETTPVKANFTKGNKGFHGDVTIEKIDSLPENFDQMTIVTDNVLALGEATGHMHKLFGNGITVREDKETKAKYLHLVEEVVLKHQEHKPVILPPGIYRQGFQTEYDHFGNRIREVAD